MIEENEWLKILEENNFRCFCCGSDALPLTKDHVIPLSLGGEDREFNIQPLCQICNSEKGDRIIDYRGSLKFNGRNKSNTNWYTIRHAANILHISPSTIKKRIRENTIPHITGTDGRKYVWITNKDEIIDRNINKELLNSEDDYC